MREAFFPIYFSSLNNVFLMEETGKGFPGGDCALFRLDAELEYPVY